MNSIMDVDQVRGRFLNKVTVSWILYDVANSAYILIIPAVSYSVYYRTVVCGADEAAEARWALIVSAALGCAGLLAPFVGALADIGRLRRRLFLLSTIVCCILTAALFMVGEGDMLVGGLLFFAAHLTYALAISLYDSFLRDIVDPSLSGRLSGVAWGVGYLGGILCLAICYPLLKGGLELENLGLYRLAFVAVALFYLVLGLPALLWMPRAKESLSGRESFLKLTRDAYFELWHTLRSWKEEKDVFRFIAASYFISDAITTVIYFTAIYLQANFGLTVIQILGLTLLVQVIGIPTTGVFGYLGDRWDKKKAIMVTIAIWIVVILIMVFGTARYTPIVMACLMGLVLGSTQALCRSLYSDMIPAGRVTEFFGFNTFAGKVSSILGPIMFGLVTMVTHNQRVALASLLVFFLIGAGLLRTVHFAGHRQTQY